ncbi:hypothetical protein RR46_02156 [Papilio xuthus]|uniref:Uncharacterized protein n=1 Tax=Papilio xuthus TaxID=66420 RepID=A0A194QKV6_PAPXU|nr:hypothetical protein RR46_02156 [Papilio xuthus]
MRRTFPRRWVLAASGERPAASREGHAGKPPPENGRPLRENKGAERSPDLGALFDLDALGAKSVAKLNRQYAAVIGSRVELVRLLLQVEERDSGTESDDEAERAESADAGEFCYCLFRAAFAGTRHPAPGTPLLQYKKPVLQ